MASSKQMKDGRRRLPMELLLEMAKWMRLNDLIESCQANFAMGALAKPVALKKYQKLDQLYFSDVRQLAGFMRSWSSQMSKIRAQILRQIFQQLKDLVQTWWKRRRGRTTMTMAKMEHGRALVQLMANFDQFYQELVGMSIKISQIVAVRPVDLLAHFHLSQFVRQRLEHIRSVHIDAAFAGPLSELAKWRTEDMPRLHEMFIAFGTLLRNDFPHQLDYCIQEFHALAQHALACENMLKMCADHIRLF